MKFVTLLYYFQLLKQAATAELSGTIHQDFGSKYRASAKKWHAKEPLPPMPHGKGSCKDTDSPKSDTVYWHQTDVHDYEELPGEGFYLRVGEAEPQSPQRSQLPVTTRQGYGSASSR